MIQVEAIGEEFGDPGCGDHDAWGVFLGDDV